MLLPGTPVTEDDIALIGCSLVNKTVAIRAQKKNSEQWGVEDLALLIDRRLSSTEQRMQRYIDTKLEAQLTDADRADAYARDDARSSSRQGDDLDTLIDQEVHKQLARRSRKKQRSRKRGVRRGRLRELLLDLMEDDDY